MGLPQTVVMVSKPRMYHLVEMCSPDVKCGMLLSIIVVINLARFVDMIAFPVCVKLTDASLGVLPHPQSKFYRNTSSHIYGDIFR